MTWSMRRTWRSTAARGRRAWLALALCGAVLCGVACHRRSTLPSALDDREFWALIEAVSEPPGTFSLSDNLLSNEPHVAQNVRELGPRGRLHRRRARAELQPHRQAASGDGFHRRPSGARTGTCTSITRRCSSCRPIVEFSFRLSRGRASDGLARAPASDIFRALRHRARPGVVLPGRGAGPRAAAEHPRRSRKSIRLDRSRVEGVLHRRPRSDSGARPTWTPSSRPTAS